jgi:diguanylate cyclase (GGDEF)-like protein
MANRHLLPVSQELIDAIPAAVFVTGTDDSVLLANHAACLLCELDAPASGSHSLGELLETDGTPAGESTLRIPSSERTISVIHSTAEMDDGKCRVHVVHPAAAPWHGSGVVLDRLIEGVMVVAPNGDVLYINQPGRDMLDIDRPAAGINIRDIFTADEAISLTINPLPTDLLELLSGDRTETDQLMYARYGEASPVELHVNGTSLFNSSGDPAGAILTFLNVTGHRHAEMQIDIQNSVLNAIANGGGLSDASELLISYLERVIPDSRVAVYQIERESRQISLVAARRIPPELRDALRADATDPISGLCVQSLMRRSPVVVDLKQPVEDEEMCRLLSGAGMGSVWSYPVDALPHRGIGVICVYRTVAGRPDHAQERLIATATGLLRITMDRVEIERELRYQSFNDDLTGLPNRVLLMDRLELAIQRTAKSDERIALLLINIDRFQSINNSLGHQSGDQILREVARRLRSSVRSDDLVARFTGDSFAILLSGIEAEADAINVVMRMQRSFAPPISIEGVDLYISLSIGISMSNDQGSTADDLVQYSDIALNRAREAGRGQFAIFSPELDLSRIPRIELQSKLHRALAADALELHFQPVMSLHAKEVMGYEALVRWTDPDYGAISPDEFLPLAEQAGIMAEITSWVLDNAVSRIVEWQQKLGRRVFASVNISPAEMNESLLVEQVDAVLARYQMNPECLLLEMTEHALVDVSGQPTRTLQGLRELGVRIALDDFGTGYSSLSYLEQLPIDAIKIDRAFIQAARGGPSRYPVATAMVNLARQLGMFSVAEGIETEEDERVARQIGCDLSQGYFYGRPVAATDEPPLISV